MADPRRGRTEKSGSTPPEGWPLDPLTIDDLPEVPVAAPLPDAEEYPVYAALKLDMCERLRENPDAARETEYTSRRFQVRFVPGRKGGQGRRISSLYGITPYFLRDRLAHLNHGTIIEETRRGLRNARVYQWREPIHPSNLDAFEHLHRLTHGQPELALDASILLDAFQGGWFSFRDAVRRLQAASVGARATPDQTRFLIHRTRQLRTAGLLTGTDTLQLSRTGEEAAAWFTLTLAPVAGNASG